MWPVSQPLGPPRPVLDAASNDPSGKQQWIPEKKGALGRFLTCTHITSYYHDRFYNIV